MLNFAKYISRVVRDLYSRVEDLAIYYQFWILGIILSTVSFVSFKICWCDALATDTDSYSFWIGFMFFGTFILTGVASICSMVWGWIQLFILANKKVDS